METNKLFFELRISVMCICMQFSNWRNERPQLHMSMGGVFDRWSFVTDNEVVLNLARALALGIGMATFIMGFIYVLTRNFVWCPQTAGGTTYNQCYGPSLRWNNGGDGQNFVADANKGTFGPPDNGWRSIFT